MVIRNKIFCKKNGLDYIYLYDLLGLGDLDGDGLHPNPRGYKKIFERVRGFGRKYYF